MLRVITLLSVSMFFCHACHAQAYPQRSDDQPALKGPWEWVEGTKFAGKKIALSFDGDARLTVLPSLKSLEIPDGTKVERRWDPPYPWYGGYNAFIATDVPRHMLPEGVRSKPVFYASFVFRNLKPEPPKTGKLQLRGVCSYAVGYFDPGAGETPETARNIKREKDVSVKFESNAAIGERGDLEFGLTPPLSPCDDEVLRRLLNEKFDKETRDKLSKLESSGIFIQPLTDTTRDPLYGSSVAANFDRYSVTIPANRIPADFDAEAELAKWPLNMGNVPRPGSYGAIDFDRTNRFRTPKGPVEVGTVIPIAIDMYPADVFVVVTDVQPNRFRVTTAQRESLGKHLFKHPVSGSREWGFTRNPDGSMTWYTSGVDSPNTWMSNMFGGKQTIGWSGFLEGFAERFGYSNDEAAKLVAEGSYTNQPVTSMPPCYKPF